jgi:putative transposase
MYYVQVVNGRHYLEVLVLQVLYMIDSKSGGKKVYSNACGSMDYQYMIEVVE